MSPLVVFKKVFANACILFFVQGLKSFSLYTILQTQTRRKQCSNMKFYIRLFTDCPIVLNEGVSLLDTNTRYVFLQQRDLLLPQGKGMFL